MNPFVLGWKYFCAFFTTKGYVNFQGRASRREFWSTSLVVALLTIPVALLDTFLNIYLFEKLWQYLLFLPMLSLSIRRLHDTARSGWWIVSVYILDLVFESILVSLGLKIFASSSFMVTKTFVDLSFNSMGVYMISSWFYIFVFWFSAMSVLGIINFIFSLIAGSKGDNKYGEDPYKVVDLAEPSSKSSDDYDPNKDMGAGI